MFQHTAARRRLGNLIWYGDFITIVSTHSRPKAAGPLLPSGKVVFMMFQHTAARRRLAIRLTTTIRHVRFQHTAARRRLGLLGLAGIPEAMFQHTAARRRLGTGVSLVTVQRWVSTHSRPKAAGIGIYSVVRKRVSTHSRPKAAGADNLEAVAKADVSTHSRPKAAGTASLLTI